MLRKKTTAIRRLTKSLIILLLIVGWMFAQYLPDVSKMSETGKMFGFEN